MLIQGEGVRLAIAHSPFWQVIESSLPVRIKRDPIGLMMIEPTDFGDLKVKMRFNPWLDTMSGLMVSVVSVFVLLKKPHFIENLSGRLAGIVGRDSELDRSGY